MPESPLFHQLFEPASSTYTYLLADPQTLEGVIIDPVLDTIARDLQLIRELNLKLLYVVDTHVHADHITGAGRIAQETGARIALSAQAGASQVDIALKDGDILRFGRFELKALATPGHTQGCMSYLVGDSVFTGDALLVRTNGRTDFQGGSPETLYASIHEKLFTLPDATRVYPGHDYKGFTSTTIGLEKKFNARIGGNRSRQDFVQLMNGLNLEPPKKISTAVPANLKCGRES